MDAEEVRRAVADHRPGWYHVIEVAPDVVTPGWFDVRDVAQHVLPQTLVGKACLDVGTFDGFWAFEMERREAARVVAVDLPSYEQADHPPNEREANLRQAGENGFRLGAGFSLASRLLGSSVERREVSVYDLDAAALGGLFDVIVVGTLLQHLRDPVAALEHVRAVLAPDGVLLLVDDVSVRLSLLHPRRPVADFRPGAAGSQYTWYVPNLACLDRWVRVVGFLTEPLPAAYALGANGDCLVALRCRLAPGPVPSSALRPSLAQALRRAVWVAVRARRSLRGRAPTRTRRDARAKVGDRRDAAGR